MTVKHEVPMSELSEHKRKQFNDYVFSIDSEESEELIIVNDRLHELNFDDND